MNTLDEMRKAIDNLDKEIISKLSERFKVTKDVGLYKAKNGLHSKDANREKEQVERIKELSSQYGLNPEIGEAYLEFVIERVINHHKEIAKQFVKT